MERYPATAEEKLGFDVLRAQMDRYLLSPMGQVLLAEMRPIANLEAVAAELARVAELQQAYRFDDPIPLDHVMDLASMLRQAKPVHAYVEPIDLLALQRVLVTLRRVKSYFSSRRSKYPHLADDVAPITPLPHLEAQIAQTVDDEGNIRDDASPDLQRLRRLILQRREALRRTLMQALRAAIGQGYATEEQPTMRHGRMVIPIRAEAKRKVKGFIHDTSATGQTAYIEPAACLDLNNEVRELEGEERREVERILRAVTAVLRAALPEMRTNMQVLARFDLLQAKAHLSNLIDAEVPVLNQAGEVDLVEGRNPLLLLHFQRQNEGRASGEQRAVVPLNLSLGKDYRTLVITGPNAGGKSVAMKTVGLMALMLSYGLPIPAAPKTRFALFTQLIVDIGDEQSIEEDLSTFSSHIVNLKYMIGHADAGTLVLIDEAGTGTDPAEGGALAQAVLEHLTAVGARTIATTHHGTLKVYAHETEGVENGSMQFDQQTLSPTYVFQARMPGSSYAFEIARRNGLSPDVLARAQALVGAQKTALETLIVDFEARNQALEGQLHEAETAWKKAEHNRLTYEGRAEKLRREHDDIRRQALEEAERIVQEANARIEKTIREIKESEAERERTRQARSTLEAYREEVTGAQEKLVSRQRKRKRRKGRRQEEERRPKAVAGPIQKGDQVVLDEGTTAAEVLELDGKEAVITHGMMRMRVKVKRLTKVGGPRKQEVVVREHVGGMADVPALRASQRVDLRGTRVEEALPQVEQFLDQALAANLERVELLHGKGTGALREAIHAYLDTRQEVTQFEEAPWNEGGHGVTYVHFR